MEEITELKKISVIIPMYNSEKTIERALSSVINQTYGGPLEIIVVNDGSKDNSAVIVDEFIAKHPAYSIRLINQSNGGVSKARNTGLKAATGDYIALLDSDDEWLANKIQRQMNVLLRNNFDFVCALRNNDTIGFPYKVHDNIAEINLKQLLIKVVGQTSTSLFKKNVLENTGFFDEKQKYSEDANYWLRIAVKNKMAIINERLVKTDNDYGQIGLSSNMKEMEKGVQKNINEMFKLRYINLIEYLFFKSFAKFKYFIRIIKR